MAANIADIDVAGEAVRGARTIDHLPPGFNQRPPRYYLLWLMLPAILLLAAISLYPLVWLIYMTLHQVQLAPGKSDVWAGIDNFTRLASDKNFSRGWVTLFKYSALCLTAEIGLGVLVAVILHNNRLEKILVTIFLMPMMMAPVIAGFLYMFLYNGTFGWYFWLLQSIGLLEGGSILGNKSWRCSRSSRPTCGSGRRSSRSSPSPASSACRRSNRKPTWWMAPGPSETSSASPSPISIPSC